MSNTYRALTPAGEATFAEGVFEFEFTAVEERDWLASGLLEIVPRTYRALSDNFTLAAQGEQFTAALLMEHEAALISGGHIERVDEKAPEASAKKSSSKASAKKSSSAKE